MIRRKIYVPTQFDAIKSTIVVAIGDVRRKLARRTCFRGVVLHVPARIGQRRHFRAVYHGAHSADIDRLACHVALFKTIDGEGFHAICHTIIVVISVLGIAEPIGVKIAEVCSIERQFIVVVANTITVRIVLLGGIRRERIASIRHPVPIAIETVADDVPAVIVD